jgi:hypothetical protein
VSIFKDQQERKLDQPVVLVPRLILQGFYFCQKIVKACHNGIFKAQQVVFNSDVNEQNFINFQFVSMQYYI